MNVNIENQEFPFFIEQAEDFASQAQSAEITPSPLECFKLVGGGDSLVLLVWHRIGSVGAFRRPTDIRVAR